MKIKVDVSDLVIGMFVTELDRPWMETSFLFEGVLIKGDRELKEFRSKCKFVYIDTDESSAEVRDKLLGLGNKPAGANRTAAAATSQTVSPKQVELEQRHFQAELKVARRVHGRTKSFIDKCLNDVRLGRSVDTRVAREVVSEMADSITRSPAAMMLLSHMKSRDEYTSVHSMNVCIMSLSFGRCLGLPREELEILGLGALLHDVGKMKIPLEILNKPGRLTEEEFKIVKTHPVEGFKLITQQDARVPQAALDIIMSHHERRNGNGYPQGISGDLIGHLTRIVAIVDVYDAITSDRSYHDAITPFEALKNMYDWINRDFDKDIIEQFIKCLGIYPIGSVVELNMGHVGIVVSASEKSRLRPILLLMQDRKGKRYDVPKLINLAHPKWHEGGKKLEITRILSKQEYNFNIKQIIANEDLM